MSDPIELATDAYHSMNHIAMLENDIKILEAKNQALIDALKQAQESLILARLNGRHVFNGSWVDRSMSDSINAITALLSLQIEET